MSLGIHSGGREACVAECYLSGPVVCNVGSNTFFFLSFNRSAACSSTRISTRRTNLRSNLLLKSIHDSTATAGPDAFLNVLVQRLTKDSFRRLGCFIKIYTGMLNCSEGASTLVLPQKDEIVQDDVESSSCLYSDSFDTGPGQVVQ